jgi:hypothetical protein
MRTVLHNRQCEEIVGMIYDKLSLWEATKVFPEAVKFLANGTKQFDGGDGADGAAMSDSWIANSGPAYGLCQPTDLPDKDRLFRLLKQLWIILRTSANPEHSYKIATQYLLLALCSAPTKSFFR